MNATMSISPEVCVEDVGLVTRGTSEVALDLVTGK